MDPGFTASDSLTFVEPIIAHAPDQKTMAKQWYHGYKYGPIWVPPIVASGTLSNLYLAYFTALNTSSSFSTSTPSTTTRFRLYLLAALSIFSILPITFFYMEPGINGAAKWKVQCLLKDEGFSMPETKIWKPSSLKHGGTQESRRWAERTSMRELIVFWRKVNNFRWVVGGVAAGLSGWATLGLVG